MTSLSRLLAIAVISGCATHPAPAETSLVGPISCGSATCGDNQLCVTQPSGIPGGATTMTCATVAPGCAVFDCQSHDPNVSCPGCIQCSTCVDELCGYYPELQMIGLVGRMLGCPAA